MNTLTKQIIGAVVGGAIGLFIAQVAIDYIELRKEMLESNENLDWLNGDEEDHGDLVVEKTKERTLLQKPAEMKKKSQEKNYTQYFLQQDRPDLAALAAKYNGDEKTDKEKIDESIAEVLIEDEMDGTEYVEEIEFEKIEDDQDRPDPCVIRMEEYAEDDEFAHITLSYYEDEVVTDEGNNPITHPEQIIGEDALVSFGELSGDPDIVYVRNLEKRAMYEIVRMNKPFAIQPVLKRRPKLNMRLQEGLEEENGEIDNT